VPWNSIHSYISPAKDGITPELSVLSPISKKPTPNLDILPSYAKLTNTSGQFLPLLYSSFLFFLLSFSFREKYELVALLLKAVYFSLSSARSFVKVAPIRLLQKMSFGRDINPYISKHR